MSSHTVNEYGAWCPVFNPTRSEFACFSEYIRNVIEPQCKHIGICKVLPPRGWFMRSYTKQDLSLCTVSKPVSQHIAGKKGVFNVDLVERKTTTVEEFQELAQSREMDAPPDNIQKEDIERYFWKSLRPTMDAPVYGADIVGTLFGTADAMSWNLSDLKTILRTIDLPGITRSMLYFGMWRSMFAFHTEDMDLYSINYLHMGKPKFWYAVSPQNASKLERAAQSLFPDKAHACPQFLRHKTSLISPNRLKDFGVPYSRALQQPGEFVITFPESYHQGFNLGYNIAEAVNFATLRWIPFGLKAKVCRCSTENVHIDMDMFLVNLFESTQKYKSKVLPDDAWILSCKCHAFASSDEPEYIVNEPWFECSSCRIWCHLGCVHKDLVQNNIKDENRNFKNPTENDNSSEKIPETLLCHRCMLYNSTDTTELRTKLRPPRNENKKTMRPNTKKISPHKMMANKTQVSFSPKLPSKAKVPTDSSSTKSYTKNRNIRKVNISPYKAKKIQKPYSPQSKMVLSSSKRSRVIP